MEMATVLWKMNGSATCDGHLAISQLDALASFDDRNQASGTSCIDVDSWTTQIQLVRDPRRLLHLVPLEALGELLELRPQTRDVGGAKLLQTLHFRWDRLPRTVT